MNIKKNDIEDFYNQFLKLDLNNLLKNYKGEPVDILLTEPLNSNTHNCIPIIHHSMRYGFASARDCEPFHEYYSKIFQIYLGEKTLEFVNFKKGMIQSIFAFPYETKSLEIYGNKNRYLNITMQRKHFRSFQDFPKISIQDLGFHIIDDLFHDLVNLGEFSLSNFSFSSELDVTKFLEKSKGLGKLMIRDSPTLILPGKEMRHNKKITHLDLIRNNITELP